jgi:hypothetical protein
MTQNNKWLVNTLRSPYVLVLMLVGALSAQFPHARYVFYHLIPRTEQATGWSQASFYALVMECMIAVFVIHNWHKFSYVFAGVSLGGVDMFSASQTLWVYYLFAFILPVAIAALTHMFADSIAAQETDKQSAFNWRKWLDSITSLKLAFAVDLARNLFPVQETQVVVVEDASENVSPTEYDLVPTQVAHKVDPKYLPVLQALTENPQGLRVGTLSNTSGVPHSTLWRYNKETGHTTGWLVTLVKQGLVEERDRLFFLREGL